jgi:hypothetical protein
MTGDFSGTSRFRVLRRIGAGGMGVVYEAEDVEHGRRVALKTLKHTDSDTLYRLKQEFRTLADLSHPNLVALHELVVGEQCFFTMELLQGTDVVRYVRAESPRAPGSETDRDVTRDATVVSSRGSSVERATPAGASSEVPCDETRLRAVLAQLVHGLVALHAAGKIHRDVKPSNVLVTDEGRVVLVDFGLVTPAEPTERDSFAGHVVGTVSYMAPEQCRGDPRLTPAVDFYAVGVVLYEALTGVVPFVGPTARVLALKQQEEPIPPREMSPRVAPDLDALCVDLLARDPARRPGAEEILRRLGVAVDVTAAVPARSRVASPLAGRDDELARLEDGLAAAARGPAAAAMVRGASGIGKSALCQRFLDEARRRHRDLVALQGRCYERETVPYQAMDSLIDHLSHYWLGLSVKDAGTLLPREAALLARLFPVLGRVPCVAEAPRAREIADPQEQRTRAFAALREVLQRIGERHPLVLLLDDMQWVDANTLAVLADLMRPPDPPRLLLVLSTRPEGSEALEEVVRRMDASAATIDLPPLAERAATELAGLLLGADGAARAAEVAREAGGNPFFIGELVQYLQTVDRASLRSVRLDDVIAQRIAQLSETGRRLLELVALAGEPITRRALGSALGGAAGELAGEAVTLGRLRFIRTAGAPGDDRVEPYHDRVRDAATASLSEETRRAHHRALALAYRSDVSDEQLARHWHGAGEDARAAEHARKAADEAMARFDFDRAAGLYAMALRMGGPPEAQRRELLTSQGEALASAGRPREAAQALVGATEGAEPARRIELRRRSAEELLRGGYLEEGLASIQAVLTDFGLRLAPTSLRALVSALLRRAWLRLRGLAWRARSVSDIRPSDLVKLDVFHSVAIGLGFVDIIRGFDYQVRGLLFALRLGEPGRVARALAVEAAYLVGVGQLTRARRSLVLAKRAAAQSGSPYATALAELAQGIVDYFAGHTWRLALDELVHAEQLFLAQGRAGWEVDTAQHHQSFALLYLGELLELGRRVPGYVREAERRGDQFASVSLRTRMNLIWLARDEVARADEELESALAAWLPEEKGFLVQHYWALLSRGETCLYRGAADAGAARIERGLPGLRRAMLMRVPFIRIELGQLRGRLALARAATAGAASPHVVEARGRARALDREQLPLARWYAALLSAGAANLEGRVDEARELLQRALAWLDGSETRLYAAAARRRLGETLGGDAGRALCAEADAWYAGQGVKDPARMTAMLVPGWR